MSLPEDHFDHDFNPWLFRGKTALKNELFFENWALT